MTKCQVATDLGRLEACLRTDTKMETQDRKSHEADAGCAFLVTINIKDHVGRLVVYTKKQHSRKVSTAYALRTMSQSL